MKYGSGLVLFGIDGCLRGGLIENGERLRGRESRKREELRGTFE